MARTAWLYSTPILFSAAVNSVSLRTKSSRLLSMVTTRKCSSKMRARMYSVFVRAPERLKSSISRSWSRLSGRRKWKASHFGGRAGVFGRIMELVFRMGSAGDFGAEPPRRGRSGRKAFCSTKRFLWHKNTPCRAPE